MTDSPLISVIVPVYNRERYLAASIDSVLAQDYRPFELIVVDDGSTDGTAAVLNSYPQARSIYQSNQGQSVARNVGISASRGEYLAFLDSDDLWPPNKLSVQIRFHLSNPHVGYSITHASMFLEAGCPLPRWQSAEALCDSPAVRIPSALMVRKDAMERIGGFSPLFRVSEDLEWFLRAQESGIPMGILPDVLLQRRIHDANLSAREKEIFTNSMHALKALMERKRIPKTT